MYWGFCVRLMLENASVGAWEKRLDSKEKQNGSLDGSRRIPEKSQQSHVTREEIQT